MTRTRFQYLLQNLHFSNDDNDDKTDKSYKIRPVIEHLNKVFAASLSNSWFQSGGEHIGRSSMKQYIKNKPIKSFKICIALKWIASFVSRKLSCPNNGPSKRTKTKRAGSIFPSQFPFFLFFGDKTTM